MINLSSQSKFLVGADPGINAKSVLSYMSNQSRTIKKAIQVVIYLNLSIM